MEISLGNEVAPEITCDVLVVGGGPAGSTAAYELARSGMDVVLFDRQTFPRHKLCAGLLTKKTIRLIENIFGPCLNTLKTENALYHTFREYRIYRGVSSELARGRLSDPFHLADRFHYDAHWLHQARKAGVRVFTGKAIDKVCPETGAAVSKDGATIQSRIIIAADGVHSGVRSRLFDQQEIKQRWWPQLAQTIEVKFPADRLPKQPAYASLHFGLVPWGYAWSFPAGQWHILGICGLPSQGSTSLKNGFQRYLNARGFSTDRIGPWRSHPLPYGNYLHSPSKARVLLAGDACGLADPLLGEGIYYAHKSGQLAARAITESHLNPDLVGRAYHHLLKQNIFKEFRWIRFFRNLMFMGGHRRKFRSLQILFRLKRRSIEDALQGDKSFQSLFWL
jgi:geranylgeranyl reductase family protein